MKLPRIAPRKEEVAAVEEILESGEYEDAKKMARAIIAKSYEMLLDRDWYFIGFQNDGQNLLFGLFATENAAVKAIPTLGVSGTAAIFKVQSLSDRRVRLEDLLEAGEEAYCRQCGHPEATHELPYRAGCFATGCTCTKYQK